MLRRISEAWILGLVIACQSVGPEVVDSPLERHEYKKLVMGTHARLVLYASNEAQANEAARAAFGRMVELDERLSHWNDASEVAHVGRQHVLPIAISDDLEDVLTTALDVAKRSDGLFDPLLGADLEPDGSPRAEPETFRVSWNSLSIDEKGLWFFSDCETPAKLDLGGIAKGFAADEALEVLNEHGIDRALVDIGGDLALGAAPPMRDGWTIAVGSDEDTVTDHLTLSECGVATSGSTARSHTKDGVRFSHIFDPRVAHGVTHDFVSTVVAPDATQADALATVANIVAEGGEAFMNERFPEARVILHRPQSTELFDGKTLTGWTPKGGRYDGNAVWSVEDGAIVGRTGPNGEGGLLYTEAKYASFDFECEVKMDWPFDSGIFVRMVPPGGGKGLQVTLDARPGGEVGAVYADGFLAHNEKGIEHWSRDDWNHVRVRIVGFEAKLEAWVNGHKVTDYQMPPELSGFAPTGLIGIQVHPAAEGTVEAARFRNLSVRELPMFGADQFEAVGEKQRGIVKPTDAKAWKPLFDGSSLDGWETTGSSEGYRAEDGWLIVPAEGGGWIRTRDSYQNFRLRMDFKISEMANSGLCLRATHDDANPAYSGCEIQILDDFNWERVTQTTLAPYQFTGSLYGAMPTGDRGALRPIGEWNTYEILVRGERMACSLNGRVLWDVLTSELEAAKPPFAERAAAGAIGFQRYGAPNVTSANAAWFRNVYLQELPR